MLYIIPWNYLFVLLVGSIVVTLQNILSRHLEALVRLHHLLFGFRQQLAFEQVLVVLRHKV